jgi:hypothetical protein
MEVEWTLCVLKNLMEFGAADPQTLGNGSERQFVAGNPISKTANAVFWCKTQRNRARKFHEIGVDAPYWELWWKYGAWFALHVHFMTELFVSIMVFLRPRPEF